jgi:transformation/transcription domain-associated protein
MFEKMDSYEELWFLRKRFTAQMACVTFMTYLLSIGQRNPQKFYISVEKGNIWMPELLSSISQQTLLFTSSEAVPFRLTPNLQHFISPIGLEGVFTSSLVSIADVLGNANVF